MSNREATSREQQAIAAPQEDNAPQASSSQEHHGIGDSSNATGATSGEGDPALVLSTHDRDALNDILARPEAYQINVEIQLAADSPKDDQYPQLAPSPDSLHPALYAPLSRTIPLPALEEQGPSVAPAQSGPAASSSGNTNAAQTTGDPLAFPSLEMSSTHSESSALLHYSPAAEAETRRYDEGSARRELAAMMSDPPRRVADPEVEAEQQQQSVSPDAVPASHREAAQPSSPPHDGVPPDDDAQLSCTGADENLTIRDVSEENPDSTHIHYRDFVVTDGVFLGRRLLISVGKKSQLPVPSEPFDEGLRSLLHVCEARRHDLVQLHLEAHQVWVTGGQHATQDALDAILFRLRSNLRNFATAVVSFTATDDGRAGQAVQDTRRAIAGGFSRLKHVRIQGNTSAARLSTFPLASLCALEVLIRITEADMIVLLRLCSDKLAFLAAGPVDDSQGDCLSAVALDSCAQAVPKKASSFVMYIKSQSPCEHLLKFIAQESVDVHFTLTDARGSARLRDIVDGHPTWTMRLD